MKPIVSDFISVEVFQPFPAVAHIDKINMPLEFFPFDAYLPTLPTLQTRPSHKLVEEMLVAGGISDDSEISQYNGWTAKPTRYRPHLGATFKIILSKASTPQSSDVTQYFKILRHGEAAAAYKHLVEIHCNNQSSNYFSPVKPLACIVTKNAVLLEVAPGVPFDKLLRDNENVIESTRRIAMGLAEFHKIGNVPRQRDPAEFMQRAERAVDLLTWADSALGTQAGALLNQIRPKMKFNRLCATHLDMKPDHVLVDHQRITFIDMDSSAMSDPTTDVAMMLVRLDAMHPIEGVPLAVLESAKRAFLDTYYQHQGQGRCTRLSAHQGLASLKIALYYLQHLEPDWQRHISSLLENALKVLNDDV